MKKALAIIFILVSLKGFTQVNFDSLEKVIDTTKTVKKKIERYYFGTYGKDITKKEFDAIERRLMELGKSKGDKRDLARAHYRIAWHYYYNNRFDESLAQFFECLKIGESIHDSVILTDVNSEIADAYLKVKNKDFAKRHCYHGLRWANPKRKEDKKPLNVIYHILSGIYKDEANRDSALKYCEIRLAFDIKNNNKAGIATAYNSFALVYKKLKEYDKAIMFFEKSLAMRKELGDIGGQAGILINIGNNYKAIGNYTLGIKYSLEGTKLAVEAGNKVYQRNGVSSLADGYWAAKDYKLSAAYYRRYDELKDSIDEKSLSRQINELTTQYEAKEKDADLALKEEQIKSAGLENSRQRMMIVASGIALIAFSIAIFFIYRSYKLNKRNAKQLEFKNKLIEEKQKEITDSINYARLIQQSLLASKQMLDKNLQSYFIFYKPKDIVSGDFYWASETNEGFAIACVDCTGHGVPGAFMSLIGKENLDKAVSKFNNPGQILAELNKGVKKSLNQNSTTGNKDGMDAALLRIQKSSTGANLFYSGANRPLIIIRKDKGVVEEIKATKQAIGGFTSDEQIFDEHEFSLLRGDMVYISTDGYADQFGSDKNKKLTTKRFKDLLVLINRLEADVQKQELENFFNEWKGRNEQLDDLLVIGIRI